MTHLQGILHWFGCARFKWFRRWVGGRWAERAVPPTEPSRPCWTYRWEQTGKLHLDDVHVTAIEQWTVKLPSAALERKRDTKGHDADP